MGKELKERILKWRIKLGYDTAKRQLLATGISNGVAQKLLAGSYPNEPKALLMQAIDRAIKGGR